jgi:hypothetical protein
LGVLARLPGRGMDGVFEDDIQCPGQKVLEDTFLIHSGIFIRLGIFVKAYDDISPLHAFFFRLLPLLWI